MRKTYHIKMLATSVLLVGCASCQGMIIKESFRAATPATVDVEDLGFVKGKTSIEEAERIMKTRKMTGITMEVYAASPEKAYGFLTADYQTRVYVFENFRYRECIELQPTVGLPYGFALRAAAVGDRVMLLVLYRDPGMAASGKGRPPSIEAYLLDAGGFARSGGLSMDRITRDNGGMSFPFFVGHDLSEGVIFVARNAKGVTWGNAYILRRSEDGFDVQTISLFTATRCASVLNYMNGRIANEP